MATLLGWTLTELLPCLVLFRIHYRNFISFEGNEYVEIDDGNNDSESEYNYKIDQDSSLLDDNERSIIQDLGLPVKTSLDKSKGKKTLSESSFPSTQRSKFGFSYYFKNASSFGSKQQ